MLTGQYYIFFMIKFYFFINNLINKIEIYIIFHVDGGSAKIDMPPTNKTNSNLKQLILNLVSIHVYLNSMRFDGSTNLS